MNDSVLAPRPSSERIVGVGVDFGTTNSVVALAHADGAVECLDWSDDGATFRTALMFWRDGREVRHVAGPGAVARAIAADNDGRFVQSIKTHVASRVFAETRLFGARLTIEDLVARVLADLLNARRVPRSVPIVCGRPVVYAGESPDEALAVARMTRAFALVGRDDVRFAFEPLGAAYWYARRIERPETVLVADFGGGTSDFSVLRFTPGADGLRVEARAHAGVGVAGDTFDYRLLDHVAAPHLGKGGLYRSFDKLLPFPAYVHAAFAQWHKLSWLKSPATMRDLVALNRASEPPGALDDLLTMIECDLGFALYRAVNGAKAALSSATETAFEFEAEGIRIAAGISRASFETWIADDVAALDRGVSAALARAGTGCHGGRCGVHDGGHLVRAGGATLVRGAVSGRAHSFRRCVSIRRRRPRPPCGVGERRPSALTMRSRAAASRTVGRCAHAGRPRPSRHGFAVPQDEGWVATRR